MLGGIRPIHDHVMRTRSIGLPRILAGGAALLLLLCGPAASAEPDDFRAVSASDLAALCSADPNEPDYVAAIHFCHGFAAGAYQYYQAIAAASSDQRYVCPPSPPPSRSEAISGFVDWMKSRSELASTPPVEALFRYLAETYPCKQ